MHLGLYYLSLLTKDSGIFFSVIHDNWVKRTLAHARKRVYKFNVCGYMFKINTTRL